MSAADPDLVIVGAGGHGREVFDAVVARDGSAARVLGFVDDAPTHPERVARLGSVLLGDVDWLARRLTGGALDVVVGIGTGAVRAAVADRVTAAGGRVVGVVHPGAHLGPDVELGAGVVVFDRCTLTTDVRVGDHTHLNVGCAVQHDSVLGARVQCSPGVFVNGDCVVGDDVFLGTGALVTRGVTVGEGARVGAGAVVLDDVAPGATVVGVPARPVSR